MSYWSKAIGGIDGLTDDQIKVATADFEAWAVNFPGRIPPLSFVQFVRLMQSGGVPPAGDAFIQGLLEDVRIKIAVVLAVLIVSMSSALDAMNRPGARASAVHAARERYLRDRKAVRDMQHGVPRVLASARTGDANAVRRASVQSTADSAGLFRAAAAILATRRSRISEDLQEEVQDISSFRQKRS